MNHDEKFNAWKERPVPLNIPPDFAGDVMRRIYREAAQRQSPSNWSSVLEFFQRNRSLQFAVLAVAAIVGLIRFWLMFSLILEP